MHAKNRLGQLVPGKLLLSIVAGGLLAACGGGAQDNSTSAPQLLANGEQCNPAWSSSAVYTGGNAVSYNGVNYTAAYWTQGNNPSVTSGPAGSGQPWITGFTCGGTTTTTKATTTTTKAGTTTTKAGTTTTTKATTTTTAGGSCAAYVAGTSYAVGKTVTNAGGYYTCTVAGWCSSGAPAYEPGVGWAWGNAWSAANASACGGTTTTNKATTTTTKTAATSTVGTTTTTKATTTTTTVSTGDGSVWKGHNWNITNGGMAGVAPGSPSNVFVDSNGYLHLKITKTGGSTTAAEMFSKDRMGFGTYQWQIQGAIDNMDKSTVLGLFPYGPADGIGGDGENEIDIEFSKWNNGCGCDADFTFYPSTGNSGLGSATDNFTFSLNGGNLTTARFEWRSNRIVGTIMSGLQPIGVTANVLRTFTLAPTDTRKIPQVPLPLGMNFWAFEALPASNQEVIIRDFQYQP